MSLKKHVKFFFFGWSNFKVIFYFPLLFPFLFFSNQELNIGYHIENTAKNAKQKGCNPSTHEAYREALKRHELKEKKHRATHFVLLVPYKMKTVCLCVCVCMVIFALFGVVWCGCCWKQLECQRIVAWHICSWERSCESPTMCSLLLQERRE